MPEGLGLSGLQRPGHSEHMDELLAGGLEDPDYNNEHYSLRWEDCAFETK